MERITNTKECAKIARTELKKLFPQCKFSVQTEYYSMGSTIHARLMQAPFKVVMSPHEITDEMTHRYGPSTERQREIQVKGYHQLNQYTFNDEYGDGWNNGVFLTRKGWELLKKMSEVVNRYNWDNSDSMTDYFDVNFHVSLYIGKFDKPFIQPEKVVLKQEVVLS